MRTGMKAWVKQRKKDVTRKGKKKAPWIVFWNEPDGTRREKSCGPGKNGWRLAQKEATRIHNELVSGTYGSRAGKSWSEFRTDYDQLVLEEMQSANTRKATENALSHFERIISPSSMSEINSKTIDVYKAQRAKEPGKKPGSLTSPATINKELRHIRAVLNKARRWGFLQQAPEIDFEREPEKLIIYVPPEHFADIYKACEIARLPRGQAYTPAQWWRALLVMAYMTGWRIGDLLSLRREDLGLDVGTAIVRHTATKEKRDYRTPLHPIVIEHLRPIVEVHNEPVVLPWKNHPRTLYSEFTRIQEAAGIHLPCPDADKHKCTRACHVHGFHDERRAFATMNASRLTADAVQSLMRHRSYKTTQKYINMGPQLAAAVESLYVPEVGESHGGGK